MVFSCQKHFFGTLIEILIYLDVFSTLPITIVCIIFKEISVHKKRVLKRNIQFVEKYLLTFPKGIVKIKKYIFFLFQQLSFSTKIFC